jgi:hypothetical protein
LTYFATFSLFTKSCNTALETGCLYSNELSSENGSDVDAGLVSTAQSKLPGQMSEADSQSPEPGQTAPAGAPSAEGRRTQLRIVRENIQALSKDVGSFRKSHEVSIKSLEKQLASLRKELAARASAKDSGGLSKSYEASAKRMEQAATLRKELSALKTGIAKDAARSRAKQEAMLSKILAKVSAKTSKPAKRATKR